MKRRNRNAANRQSIDAKVDELLAEVEIPQPWDRDEFARRLTLKFGKLVRILPLSTEVGMHELLAAGITGMIIESELSVSIYFANTGSEIHQQNVILHEVGHYELGDVREGQVMCRSAFGSPREAAAERFGRAVLHRVRGGDSLQLAPHTDDPDGVRSLGGALADIE